MAFATARTFMRPTVVAVAAKAEAALDGLARAQPGQDREYLTAKVARWQKWADTARKQMERSK